MVEPLAAGTIGECFCYEAAEADNGDGGPACGEEFFLASSLDLLAKRDRQTQSEKFCREFEAAYGAGLPGQMHHELRHSTEGRTLPQ